MIGRILLFLLAFLGLRYLISRILYGPPMMTPKETPRHPSKTQKRVDATDADFREVK